MNYVDIVTKLREAFPAPTLDPRQDAWLVQTINQAIVDTTRLKNQSPILTVRKPRDYSEAREARMAVEPNIDVSQITARLTEYLEGLTIWGHPLTQENVVPPPTIPGIVASLLCTVYNPNLVWDQYSRKVAQAEIEMTAMMADLLGFDPEIASGVFTFGGTGTVFYGVKAGLEKALPGSNRTGVPAGEVVILAGERSHFCSSNASEWLGIGTDNLWKIPSNDRHETDVAAFEVTLRKALDQGKKVAAIVATMGTTDHFAIDDLAKIVAIRDQLALEYGLSYKPHIHADAVIGWAWSVFNDYFGPEQDADPLSFQDDEEETYRTLVMASRRIRKLKLADSVGIDFHKTGFTPYLSSMVMFRNTRDSEGRVIDDLGRLHHDPSVMPYLFQFGEYKPGEYTMETTRPGTGIMMAMANMMLFGKRGMQALLGYLVSQRLRLKSRLDNDAHATVLNPHNPGTVNLFRTYPNGVETPIIDQERNDPAWRDRLLYYNGYNLAVEKYIHERAMAGEGVVLSKTNEYATTTYEDPILKIHLPIVSLKSYMMSPFIEKSHVDLVYRTVKDARKVVTADSICEVLQSRLADLKAQSEAKLGTPVDFDPAAEARRICDEQSATVAR
jgi:glutamate/tyrosine decarboxylase-like PLP-dependent enzyme